MIMAKFRTILCDPPWKYETFSDTKQGAAIAHYSGMTLEQLASLPVASVTANNAALLLWCTWPKLLEGVALFEAWGFRYVSGFPWMKMTAAACPRRGIGWHTHSVSEFVLIGVKGTGMTPPVEKRQPGVIFSPIGKHSAKPDMQYLFAEGYGGPYLELFARPDGGLDDPRPNWTRAGNEIDGKDMQQALCDLAALPDIIVSALDTENTDNAPTDAQETLF